MAITTTITIVATHIQIKTQIHTLIHTMPIQADTGCIEVTEQTTATKTTTKAMAAAQESRF